MKLNADDRAEAAEEALAEAAEQFYDDAADELLAQPDALCNMMCSDGGEKLEQLLAEVLDYGTTEPSLHLRVYALRNAARAMVKAKWADEVDTIARRMAQEAADGERDWPAFDSLNDSLLGSVCPVPAFPGVRGGV